jgi:hypothetical protein
MTTDVPAGRRTVRLVDVPVDLYRRAQQHTDDVLRELVLMADHERARGTSGTASRLVRLAGDHRPVDVEVRVSTAPDLDGARARGEETVTLTCSVDLAAADSAEGWARVLDELDELCRSGDLLSVPPGAEVGLFTRWFCGELVRQLRDGEAPCPWPRYADAARAER